MSKKARIMRHDQGFSLLEMLLVVVIVTALIVMGINYTQQRMMTIRIDKTVQQMEQILNAALTYYVANGKWPTSMACLYGEAPDSDCTSTTKYLPYSTSAPMIGPWGAGSVYSAGAPADASGAKPIFYVMTTTPVTYTPAIVGRLPLGFTAESSSLSSVPVVKECTASPCYTTASVTIPGQNLNNASAVNFAGVYNHGSCVPAPNCPSGMTPQIMVVPASVSGFAKDSAQAFDTSGAPNVYPISSFTAYAKGGGGGTSPTTADPDECDTDYTRTCSGVVGQKFWRVCIKIMIESGKSNLGNYYSSSKPLANAISLMAFTRCAITGEESGTPYTVFS